MVLGGATAAELPGTLAERGAADAAKPECSDYRPVDAKHQGHKPVRERQHSAAGESFWLRTALRRSVPAESVLHAVEFRHPASTQHIDRGHGELRGLRLQTAPDSGVLQHRS